MDIFVLTDLALLNIRLHSDYPRARSRKLCPYLHTFALLIYDSPCLVICPSWNLLDLELNLLFTIARVGHSERWVAGECLNHVSCVALIYSIQMSSSSSSDDFVVVWIAFLQNIHYLFEKRVLSFSEIERKPGNIF